MAEGTVFLQGSGHQLGQLSAPPRSGAPRLPTAMVRVLAAPNLPARVTSLTLRFPLASLCLTHPGVHGASLHLAPVTTQQQ